MSKAKQLIKDLSESVSPNQFMDMLRRHKDLKKFANKDLKDRLQGNYDELDLTDVWSKPKDIELLREEVADAWLASVSPGGALSGLTDDQKIKVEDDLGKLWKKAFGTRFNPEDFITEDPA